MAKGRAVRVTFVAYGIVALLIVLWVLAQFLGIDRLSTVFSPARPTLIIAGSFCSALVIAMLVDPYADGALTRRSREHGGDQEDSSPESRIVILSRALLIGAAGATALVANLLVISQYLPGREQTISATIQEIRKRGNPMNPCFLTLSLTTTDANQPPTFTICADSLSAPPDFNAELPIRVELTVRVTALGSVLVRAKAKTTQTKRLRG
jgi:hypothetical protein